MKFTKYDGAKSRMDLLPAKALEMVGFVLRHGAREYAPHNWRKCKNPEKYLAAALRHIFKHLDDNFTDRDSGLLHLAHAACSVLFALDLFVKMGENNKMERKQFSYFGVIERKSKKRGVVLKRFRSYDKAWTYLTDEKLLPEKHSIRTVSSKDKIGQTVSL